MSEPKFAPGPWEAHTSYDELWGDDVWYQTEYHSVMANGNTIASDVSSKENATLMAESPNMYKMLEEDMKTLRDMAEWLEKMRGMKDTALVRVMFQRADDIEKLLSKARGEK